MELNFSDRWGLQAPEASVKAGVLIRTEPSKCIGASFMGKQCFISKKFTFPINFNTVAYFILKLRDKNSLLTRIPHTSLSSTT